MRRFRLSAAQMVPPASCAFLALAGVLFASPPAHAAEPRSSAEAQPTSEGIRFFETKIRPLLANHCYDCHGEWTAESELRLDTLEGMLTGGNAGPSVVPGKPASSLLITAVSYRDGELRMPPGEKLSDDQLADLTRWVELGAPHPEDDTTDLPSQARGIDVDQGREHWAFQTPVQPDIPDVPEQDPFANPIDAFIAAGLQRQGLTPAVRADKRTLLRRVTYDLIGLPPTPEEIDAFLADDSPGAFSRVVDRLLASPHYGERWGRHWLDVARYADSNGLDENVAHGNAWRYRDYVVDAFNGDKPYDQFLVEQLAGDLLDSGDDPALRHERLIATGFLSLGPKVLAEVDKDKLEMDIIDEQLDTVGRSLMGLTLGCARCHDHKFDPISQTDYYALAGIFKSTRTMETLKTIARWHEHTIASPAGIARQEKHEQSVAEKKDQIAGVIAEAKQELEPLESEPPPEELESRFPEGVRQKLKTLRAELKQLEESAPVLPTAMGVTEGTVTDVALHIRGSHLTLGEVVPRRFPQVLAGTEQPRFPEDRSGRLALARWLTTPGHPLTARVLVNRLWRWHFGQGLVPTVDNFGVGGQPPSHPALLDWLATRFVQDGWSIKSLHRLILSSQTYQRASDYDQRNAQLDPENRFYWRFGVRRLQAETIRDAMLAISGGLDRQLGGSLMQTANHEHVFNHTSEDKSSYAGIRRRAVYVPVIRNHLYDMFQLFDYSDASVLDGDRETSTTAPQALFLMNSPFAAETAEGLADRLLTAASSKERPKQRIRALFRIAYGRPPSQRETETLLTFLSTFPQRAGEGGSPRAPESPRAAEHQLWQNICLSVLSSNEFLYLR